MITFILVCLSYISHASSIPLGSELQIVFQPLQQKFPKDSRACATIPPRAGRGA